MDRAGRRNRSAPERGYGGARSSIKMEPSKLFLDSRVRAPESDSSRLRKRNRPRRKQTNVGWHTPRTFPGLTSHMAEADISDRAGPEIQKKNSWIASKLYLPDDSASR